MGHLHIIILPPFQGSQNKMGWKFKYDSKGCVQITFKTQIPRNHCASRRVDPSMHSKTQNIHCSRNSAYAGPHTGLTLPTRAKPSGDASPKTSLQRPNVVSASGVAVIILCMMHALILMFRSRC